MNLASFPFSGFIYQKRFLPPSTPISPLHSSSVSRRLLCPDVYRAKMLLLVNRHSKSRFFCAVKTSVLKICARKSAKITPKVIKYVWIMAQKSRLRETKHLSTDGDSSTDTTVGWTKNTQKPNFFKNGKNYLKRKNSKTSRDMPKLAIYPSTRGL